MRRMDKCSGPACILMFSLFLLVPDGESAEPDRGSVWGPYFLGFETEPAMDAGGRLVASAHGLLTDAGWRVLHRMRIVPTSYETLFGLGLSVVQHEVFGHGSRAREYNLNPAYGFGLDFSGYTSVRRDPQNNLQMVTLASGGTEGGSLLARRLLLAFCAPDGWPAAATPLMFFTKTDLSLYVFSTAKPRRPDERETTVRSFVDDYKNGNDIALYLVSRQAQRQGGQAVDVWTRTYEPDLTEPEIREVWKHAQTAAAWNMADPMMWGSVFLYLKEHLFQRRRVTTPPALPFGDGFGVTVGTRAFLGPDSVSRFLDLYILTPSAVLAVYGRELISTEETRLGFGAGIYRLRVGSGVTLSVAGDLWENPAAPERFEEEAQGWNVNSEIDMTLGGPLALSVKIGAKGKGFFPGTPGEAGLYGGGGLVFLFY